MQEIDIVFVGPTGNTHLSGSFHQAALNLGVTSGIIDTAKAYTGSLVARKLLWRFGGRRPLRLNEFSAGVVEHLLSTRPRAMLSFGLAPLKANAVTALKQHGIKCYNYLTDDPFNPAHKSYWALESISKYEKVFTPRKSNIEDLKELGCAGLRYLPFAYDDELFGIGERTAPVVPAPTVLFVGGADSDRAAFFLSYMRTGPEPTLVGAYWERYHRLRSLSLGTKPAEYISLLTAHADVNICLVRRANRDGHVMRSFEIPAVGGFMIAEDTEDHRDFFGEEGQCVLYFKTPEEAASKTTWALANPYKRKQMARSAHEKIVGGANTYKDRLLTILG